VLKRALKLLVFASLAVAMASAADSPFIGEWKLNPGLSRMPDEMKVESKGGNTYSFDFGGGAETIVVDGTEQPGGYGGTVLSVKPEAPDTWIVERKKDGQLLLRATWKLSKDGNTLTDLFRQFLSDGSTLSIDYVYQRDGGGSGFAGHWQSIKETMSSSFTLQMKPYEGDGLSMIIPSQHSTKNLKLDGKEYPNKTAGYSASSRRIDARTLEITDKAGDKVIVTREISISADGKTLTMTVRPAGQSRPDVMVFDRE